MNIRHLRPEHLRNLRWRGYIRESTDAQAQKWSPERQRSDIERAAAELFLSAAEPRWYERTGTGEAESAELASALADARAGRYDVLLVLTTSRFARNRAEAVRMKAEFRKAGVPIYFVHERIVSGSRHAALLEGVKEVVDEEENEVRRMWIAGGQRERMLSGRWVGAIPFGYRKSLVDFADGTRGWDGGLAADERAGVVRRIFASFAGGTAPLDIAFALNAEGVRGPQGPWTRATIVKMLRNPAYKGSLVRYRHRRPSLHYYPEDDPQDGRREVDGAAIEPIIAATEWDQVQTLLDSRIVAQKAQSKRRRYPLSSILRCEPCGRAMSGVSNGYSRYYRCSARAGDHSCDQPFVRADVAEGAFADWLDTLTLPADWRSAIVETHEPDRGGEEKRRRLEERITRLRNLYAWGELAEDQYRADVATARSELAAVAEPSMAGMDELADRLTVLGRGWRAAAADQQAAVARLMLHAIIVRDARVVAFVARPELRPLLDLCLAERVDECGRLYPGDDTPGCTAEACAFRDATPDLAVTGAVVWGISPDDAASHGRFRDRFQLTFPLLVDVDHAVAEAYGTWVEKVRDGRTSMGIQRSTFLVGPDGRVAAAWPRVTVEGHAADVTATLAAAQAARAQDGHGRA